VLPGSADVSVDVLGVSYVRRLDLERQLAGAFVRGFVQVIAMGAVIGLLFSIGFARNALVVVATVGFAAWISRDRGEGIPGVFRASLVSIAAGAGLVIVAMPAAGAVDSTVRDLVPIGGMIIASAMKTNSLALDRFRAEVTSNRTEVEAVLALGAPPQTSRLGLHRRERPRLAHPDGGRAGEPRTSLYYRDDVRHDLAGATPIYAAEYQFVIMAMLFAAGGLTSVLSTSLIGTYAFTDVEQLKLFGDPVERTGAG
jgi:putative ABC transport system permease protein